MTKQPKPKAVDTMTDTNEDKNEGMDTIEDATIVSESITPSNSEVSKETSIATTPTASKGIILSEQGSNAIANIKNFEDIPYGIKIEILSNLAKDPKTGLKSPHNAVMIYEKAKELKIGWANAISHMHFIKDKLGIDLHIIKAILSRPGTGVTWIKTEDYIPVYRYIDSSGSVWDNDLALPKDHKIVNSFPKKDDLSYDDITTYVVRIPTNTGTREKPNWQILPSDFRTTYEFTRMKKHIDGTWITVKEIGRFSWLDAMAAQLPIDSAGLLNANSNWQKYRRLMVATRAFTFGSREIASDLTLGAYETSELYDINGIKYDAKEIIKED